MVIKAMEAQEKSFKDNARKKKLNPGITSSVLKKRTCRVRGRPP